MNVIGKAFIIFLAVGLSGCQAISRTPRDAEVEHVLGLDRFDSKAREAEVDTVLGTRRSAPGKPAQADTQRAVQSVDCVQPMPATAANLSCK